MHDMKENKVIWALLNTEERAVLEKAGPKNCEVYGWTSKMWLVETYPVEFYDNHVYRVKSDYEPEPEVERCEVFERDFCLRYKRGSTMVSLLSAPNDPDFMHYEYEKGSKVSMPRLTCDNEPAKVPKFVVFRRKT